MKKYIYICFYVFVISLLPSFEVSASDNSKALEEKLSIAMSENPDRVEILSFPEDWESPVGLSSDDLEKSYVSKITVKSFQETNFRSDLISQIKASAIQERSETRGRDLRWACIFYDKKGKRLLSIYFDYFGHGQVDKIPITSNGALVKFLRQKFVIN
jgi:hypothetical protein